MDSEIRISPKVDTTELADMENRLKRMDDLFKSMAQSTGRVKFPWDGSGGGGGAGVGPGSGGGPSPAGATAQATAQQAQQAARQRMPKSGRRGSAGMNSGQFLTNFQNIIEPILPELDVMMQQPGGKTNAAGALREHLSRVQRIAAQPAGSTAESQAILAANQATGVNPAALANAAAQYRATNPSHGAVISQYLSAQRQAAAGGGSGSSGMGATGIVQKLAGAAGLGEFGALLGGGLAATGIGAAALGVGFVASQTRRGWSSYRQQGTAFSALSKTIGDLGESFNTLRNQINATSLGFAESMQTITAATQAIAPYVGNVGTRGLSRYMTASQSLAFSYGMNPVATGQAAAQFGQIGVLPTNSTVGQMTPAQWAALFANAVSAGSMQGRQGQVLSSLLSVSQSLAQQLAQAPNVNRLAGIMTTLNQSGNPNLQGTLGAQLLMTMNQGIQHPGLGGAGALAEYQQLNPNGKLGYFQEQYLQSQGINGRNPTTGQGNLSAILQYYQKQLPGGVHVRHGMPGEQTASVSALLAGQLGLTQPQALHVLQAFNGKSAAQENATQALANRVGPGTLTALLHKGGLNVFAGIANATGVGGPNGLNALAHQITGTLHGHVSRRFYAIEKQYQHLGAMHPTSTKQEASIQHQRALDLSHMKTTLGKSITSGPTLATSMDKLNTTMQKADANWAKVGRDFKGIVHVFSLLNQWIGGALGPHQTLRQVLNLPKSAATGRTTAYTIPGLSGVSSQVQAGATLASFVQGNQQSTLVSALVQALGGGTPSSPSPYKNTGDPSGPPPAALASYVRMARSGRATHPGVGAYNPKISALLGHLHGRNPHLTPALIDAMMTTQDQSGNPYAYNLDKNGTMDAGVMQINSSNWARFGLSGDPYNVTKNLLAGIKMLNDALNSNGGNVFKAAESYAGSGPAAVRDAQEFVTVLKRIEKNQRKALAAPAPHHQTGL